MWVAYSSKSEEVNNIVTAFSLADCLPVLQFTQSLAVMNLPLLLCLHMSCLFECE